MFTGLIEAICSVKNISRSNQAMKLTVDLGKLADDTNIGDSISVNGVCLTVATLEGTCATFDLSSETLARSTLGKLQPSAQVNTERALKLSDRLGGHFVTGHIDGAATIGKIEKQSDFQNIKFSAPPELLKQMVVKGSVAIDGISLTISKLDSLGFTVTLVPETLKNTTLGKANVGDLVNIETDIITKTIKAQLENMMGSQNGLTIEKFKELGF